MGFFLVFGDDEANLASVDAVGNGPLNMDAVVGYGSDVDVDSGVSRSR
jgi:hypothetical protein